jgi:excisionase family DNA binding protein
MRRKNRMNRWNDPSTSIKTAFSLLLYFVVIILCLVLGIAIVEAIPALGRSGVLAIYYLIAGLGILLAMVFIFSLARYASGITRSGIETYQRELEAYSTRNIEMGFIDYEALEEGETDGTEVALKDGDESPRMLGDVRSQAPQVMTVAQASAYLQVTPAVIRRMIKEGSLNAQKVGREWRILKSELDNYLAEEGS